MVGEFKSLSETYELEFNKYCELFIKYSPRKCFFTKNGYPSCFIQIKRKTTGAALPLVGKLIVESTERHLDSALWFQKQCHNNSDYCPDHPYWLALNAPKMSKYDVIDVDAKEYIIGYSSNINNDLYKRPIVLPDIAYVNKLKLIYDQFPNRIWCISSESLGFHIWKLEPCLNHTNFLTGLTHQKLETIGLGATEVHPMVGRPFRRPFGQDYRTLTDTSIVTKWQDQLKLFEGDYRLPTFDFIVSVLLNAILEQIKFLSESKYAFFINTKINKQNLSEVVKSKIKEIRLFCRDHTFIKPSVLLIDNQEETKLINKIPNKKINHKSFYHECVHYAKFGLNEDNSLFQVTNSLAKWLYWIELYNLPVSERKRKICELLNDYIIKKHNGHVTRLLNGQDSKVFDQITRIVNCISKTTDSNCSLKLQTYRAKIQNNNYKTLFSIKDLMLENIASSSCLVNMRPPKINFDPYKPLPESLEELLISKQGKKKLEYYAKILINKILSCSGKVRLGRRWFHENWCKSNNKNESRIKLLISMGIISRGYRYSVGNFGREYSIPETILNQYWPDSRQP